MPTGATRSMTMRDGACNLPSPSRRMSLAQLLEITGASRARVVELVELGWICPARTGPGGDPQADAGWLFAPRDAWRLRKLERLCADFELHSVGGSIIVDLIERIEELERRVETLRRLL